MTGLSVVGRWIGWVWAPKAQPEITFFDVKELYNLAYQQKAQARHALRQYRRMVARAQALDEAYRVQLSLMRRI